MNPQHILLLLLTGCGSLSVAARNTESGGAMAQILQALSETREAEEPHAREVRGFKGMAIRAVLSTMLNDKNIAKAMEPAEFEKAINSPAAVAFFSVDLVDIVLEADCVKALISPEMLKIAVNSKAVKKIFSPATLKRFIEYDAVQLVFRKVIEAILNLDGVVKFLTPEFLKSVLESPAVLKYVSPATIKLLLDSKALKLAADPKILKAFLDLRAIKKLISHETIRAILNSDVVASRFTPANAKALMQKPLVKFLAQPKLLIAALETSLAIHVLSADNLKAIVNSAPFAEVFKASFLVDLLASDALQTLATDELITEFLNAHKSKMTDDMINKVLAEPTARNFFKNAKVKDYIARLYKAADAASKSK